MARLRPRQVSRGFERFKVCSIAYPFEAMPTYYVASFHTSNSLGALQSRQSLNGAAYVITSPHSSSAKLSGAIDLLLHLLPSNSACPSTCRSFSTSCPVSSMELSLSRHKESLRSVLAVCNRLAPVEVNPGWSGSSQCWKRHPR